MYIGLTEEQEALQKEVRAYYAELLTPETRAELAGGGGVGAPMRRVVRQMGEDGWLGVGWPWTISAVFFCGTFGADNGTRSNRQRSIISLHLTRCINCSITS